MAELHTLLTGLALGESPRWHNGRLWLADWVAGEILAVDAVGRRERTISAPSMPCSLDWLPNGQMLLVSGGDGRLLRQEKDGSFALYVDLHRLAPHPWNELVVDGRGNAYINTIGFDFPEGAFAPGFIALVTPSPQSGAARRAWRASSAPAPCSAWRWMCLAPAGRVRSHMLLERKAQR